jgi:hypothetical protein
LGQTIAGIVLYGGGSEMKKMLAMKVLGVFLLMSGIIMLNFVWWPRLLIKDILLMKMPIGTSMDKVMEIIERNHWEIDLISNNGYGILDDGRPSYGRVPAICCKSIKITLDHDLFERIVWVIAYLGFDEGGNLVDISVYKEYASL